MKEDVCRIRVISLKELTWTNCCIRVMLSPHIKEVLITLRLHTSINTSFPYST